MVENLCTVWGENLAHFEGKDYFAFPPIEKLAEEGVEARLRELGFGYRAKYIQQSAIRFILFLMVLVDSFGSRLISLGGASWLLDLRGKPLLEARADLMQLSGVGPKVVDNCTSLIYINRYT